MPPRNRLGVLQQAIRNRDPATILSEIESRAIHTDDGCMIWRRTSPDGYGQISLGAGRGETYVHRVALWAKLGCKGPLERLGPVHHACARRACCNSAKCLFAVTSLLNTVDAQARATLVGRIRFLEEVIRDFDATHESLDYPDFEDGDIHWLRRGPQSATPARFAEQQKRRAQRQKTLAERAAARYAQVRAVRSLRAQGVPRNDALDRVRISRAAFDRWAARLDRGEEAASATNA